MLKVKAINRSDRNSRKFESKNSLEETSLIETKES